MTDKEKIIIDGVNVLECEHYEYKSLKDCEMRYPESGDCGIGLLNYLFNGNLDIEKFCKDNPNCYFKQLNRKEQTLDEIEKELKEDIYCENQECGCDDFEECLKCTKEHILDIINKAKDTTNET